MSVEHVAGWYIKNKARSIFLKAWRAVLAGFPDDDCVGQNAHWNNKL